MMSRHPMYGLSLCSWNANGIKRKIFEFKLFIEKHNPDIILLQETHLRPSQRFNICNYNCYRNDRITDGPASGGTLILVKSTIPHFQPHSTPLQHIEASTVTLNPPNINPITITSLYIPPHSDKFLFTLDLENILQINSNCVIFGDFNATHNAWNCSHNSTRGTQLKNFADTLNLNIAYLNMPTRYGPHSSNTLDIALINNFNFPYEITSISDLSSDHNPVILNFSLCNITHMDKNRAITTCWSTFHKNLDKNIHFADILNINNPHTLEDKITHSSQTQTEANRLQAHIKKQVKIHTQQVWNDRLKALNTRDNSIWQIQRNFRNTKSNIPTLTHNSGIATSDDQKANALANSFKSNYTENKRPDDFTNNIDSDVTSTLENFFTNPPTTTLAPTNTDEVINYIKKLKNNKAPGLDNVNNKMIKNFTFKTIFILTHLINKILKLRHFPRNWKTAIVFPIHKPGKNKNSPDSYRPISLLSSLSKIAEHIILLRINQFIINTNFLNPNQYGFTKQLSTYHPLLRLTEQISAGFQRGRSTGAVFLDIQKAFDRVWISGLVYKLITNNFPAPLIHIINSYLVNRAYKVRVNNTFSLPHPQTMLNLYADDTAILATYKNHKTVTLALNKHLALLENYFNQWKIKINVEKTVAVLFTKRIKPVNPPTLYSTSLQWSQSTKYLGLILDKNLTWKHHILHARDKFRHALRLIYPLICRNSEMDMYNKVLLYTAVLRPIISYGCPVWGYAAKTNIKILEVAQNSIIRTITKAHRYTRNSNIYKALKLHPFKNYIQILAKKFFANLHNINNTNLMNLENYTPQDDHKRPRRILDSYNPP
ncbi:probable RNA-directed DNA polymerase from transposon X-element [Trichonephila clavipes]|nr:probable RNA-directed DNA polymerase from transposon X-element [Trichonephila clavipes]